MKPTNLYITVGFDTLCFIMGGGQPPIMQLEILTLILQGNLCLTNLKGPKILLFIAGIFLFMGLFTIELNMEGLEFEFFIAGILL
jgi:hypothetical protein